MKIIMEDKAKNIILRILQAIKYKADLLPNKPTHEDKVKEAAFKRIISEEGAGIVESTKRKRQKYFDFLSGKRIRLFEEDLVNCGLKFDEEELGELLRKFKEEELVKDFVFGLVDQEQDVYIIKKDCCKILLPENFNKLFKEYLLRLETAGYSRNKEENNKLFFSVETGDMGFKGETGTAKSGNKDYALLSLLLKNKKTPFNAKDIQEYCNPLVNKITYKFKGEKDIDDTIRQIRFKLKVKKGAYFPIQKRCERANKVWIWHE